MTRKTVDFTRTGIAGLPKDKSALPKYNKQGK